MNKKKLKKFLSNYTIVLKGALLLTLVLGLQVICCSNCYASSPTPINEMTPEIARSIFKYFYDNKSFNYTYRGYQSTYDSFYERLSDNSLQNFCDTWNSSNLIQYADYIENCFFIAYTNSSQVVDSIFVLFSNNELGNKAHHLWLSNYSANNSFCLTYINDNLAFVDGTFYSISFNAVGSITNFSPSNLGYKKAFNNSNLSYSTSPNVINSLTFASYGVPADINFNDEWFYTSTSVIPVVVPEPTPTPTPESTPIPGTGTITNNSGDKTGNIDLSGIENGIDNINQSINEQGQAIIDNQNTIAEQQHNDLTAFDVSDGEDDADSLINNIQDTLDDNLSNSEIFGALEESESGFLDLISGQAEDFEIHWNDVFYNNVKLIPSGQVNFSSICRENSTLGEVKEKLNIILSALCGLALIKYLYNLLLATLGIDNPYLYDSNTDNDYIKTVDKNTGVTTFSGKDKDGTRWTYRFDPKKGGKNK